MKKLTGKFIFSNRTFALSTRSSIVFDRDPRTIHLRTDSSPISNVRHDVRAWTDRNFGSWNPGLWLIYFWLFWIIDFPAVKRMSLRNINYAIIKFWKLFHNLRKGFERANKWRSGTATEIEDEGNTRPYQGPEIYTFLCSKIHQWNLH